MSRSFLTEAKSTIPSHCPNHEFTVVKPSSVPSPGTGESSFPIAVSLALMLIAAYGAVYSFARRKTTKMQTSEAE